MEQFSFYPATLTLIAINVAASVFGWSNPQFQAANMFHVGPIRQNREYHRMLTSGFLHVGVFHLLINMFVLFQFGATIEYSVGTTNFLIIYFASLVGGSLWAYLENFRNPDYRAVGASGAVSGVLLAYCLFWPFSLLYIFMIIPMPAVLFAVLFILISATLAGRENRIIGHEAHIGGALFGLVMTMIVVPDSLGIFAGQIAALFGGS